MILFTLMWVLLCTIVVSVCLAIYGIVVGQYVFVPLMLVIAILPAFGQIMDKVDKWLRID